MRKIKFRGWDKELNFMINIKRYKIDFDGQVLFDNNDKELYNQTNKIELMQYAGLKDKNDVEIYEGDIIKYDFNKFNYRIEFLNAEFIARRFYENIENLYPCEFDYGNECEVIGNIYENPDLLKG